MLAKNLRKGAKVFLFSTLLATVDSSYTQDTLCTVYNFEVEHTHNYFVGKEGVLVHNTCTEKEIEDAYELLKIDHPGKLTPGTKDHMADRWFQYKAEKAAKGEIPKDFDNWKNVYSSNMQKALKAAQKEKDYLKSIGWDKAENYQHSVNAPKFDKNGKIVQGKRRLDGFKVENDIRKGIEIKAYETGTVYNTIDIKSEVLADKHLIDKQGYEITWVFLENCKPSGPLLKDLQDAKIIVKYLP